jgi:hypothetical protein
MQITIRYGLFLLCGGGGGPRFENTEDFAMGAGGSSETETWIARDRVAVVKPRAPLSRNILTKLLSLTEAIFSRIASARDKPDTKIKYSTEIPPRRCR